MKRRVFLTVLILVLICVGFSTTANSASPIVWKMTTCWPPNYLLIEPDKYFVKLVNELAEGQMKIEFHAGDTLVSANQIFDFVLGGSVQIGGDFPGYWAGKDTAFNLLASIPFGLNGIDYMNWIYQGGGMELYHEVYGKYGLFYLPHQFIPEESGPRSNKPIRTLADYKGLKLRISGKMAGSVVRELGASQVSIVSAEVYQAMQKGVIDAAESCTPYLDWVLGYGEVTKYSSHPGWHQPGSICGLIINKPAWDKLPAHLKTVLKVAAQATAPWSYSFHDYSCIEGTKLFEDKGIKEYHLSTEDLKKIAEISNKILLEECKANPLFAKVAYSQYKYMHGMRKWRELASPLHHGWVDQPLPDLEKIKSYVK